MNRWSERAVSLIFAVLFYKKEEWRPGIRGEAELSFWRRNEGEDVGRDIFKGRGAF